MIISAALYKIAKAFPVPLYVVGGAVRNFLAGFKINDYDIAATLTPSQVSALFEGETSAIKVHKTSPKLGTLKIVCGNEYFEYTTFREDSYAKSGAHTPDSVVFVSDIITDSFRRDFTVNAIYYDIIGDVFIDKTGGIADVKNKIIRTVRDANAVFEEDALRILRLIRIAAETGFKIEDATFAAARANAPKLSAIAKERIAEEFNKMIVADTANGISGAHIVALEQLRLIEALPYIIPELAEGVGFPQRPDYHKYDVFNHILQVYAFSPPHIRLAALFHDIAKPRVKLATGAMATHEVASAGIARARLSDLRYGKDIISRVCKLAATHMYDLNCQTSEAKLRLFVQKNYDIIEDLILLKNADYIGGGIFNGDCPSALRLKKTYKNMQNQGVPFTIKDLQINGTDVLAAGVPQELCGTVLNELLLGCANNELLLTREAQLQFLTNYIKKK